MITPKTRFWIVTDPGPHSTIPDICFETDLEGMRLQMLGGGLEPDENPTIYFERDEATIEAEARILRRSIFSTVLFPRPLEDGERLRITITGAGGVQLWKGDVTV